MEPAAIWNNDGGRALMLDLGRATLELFDEKQAEVIDQLEAGQRLSGQVRFALQVPDLDAALERLLANGASLVHPPVTTPWGDRNARLQDPDGMQITLFQPTEQKGGTNA
jgi:methylmalonyl-CoA/ethylmalonyl-CoA epimerase